MLVWCTERVINDNFVGIGAVDCELESNVINVKWSYIERKFCEDVYEQDIAILRFFLLKDAKQNFLEQQTRIQIRIRVCEISIRFVILRLKFIVRSTYDSDLQRAEIYLRNVAS